MQKKLAKQIVSIKYDTIIVYIHNVNFYVCFFIINKYFCITWNCIYKIYKCIIYIICIIDKVYNRLVNMIQNEYIIYIWYQIIVLIAIKILFLTQ